MGDVPTVAGEDFFFSLTRRNGSDDFISLAPSAAAGHTMSVVSWPLPGGGGSGDAPDVIFDVPNGHQPGDPKLVGNLGYVADTVQGDNYVAMLVKMDAQSRVLDKWELVSVDLKAKTGASNPLTGQNFDILGAETISVTGVGIKGKGH